MSSTLRRLSSARCIAGRTWIPLLSLVFVILCGTVFLLRSSLRRPVEIGRASAEPISPLLRNGVWYWLEKPDGPNARLVGGAQTIASADAISSYGVDDGKIVWAERKGTRWSLSIASPDATNKKILWSGEAQLQGVCIAGNRVYWSQAQPAIVRDIGPFPPLSAQVQVYAVSVDGGAPTLLTTLMDREANLLGVQADTLYVVTERAGAPGGMAIYQVP